MTSRLSKLAAAGVLAGLCGLVIGVSPHPATSQDPPPPAAGDPNANGMEILARGPVHEAYASSAEQPTGGGPVIAKAPPEAIEELPPDQKPEGDNVQWIPGYWAWDDETADFLWVSGCWRDVPPGTQWIPGHWQEVDGGWVWVSGFWASENLDEVQYLPPPPPSLDQGPTSPAPNANSFYTPGNWVYIDGRFFWRPGMWLAYQPNWVWQPAYYVWTPG